MHEEILPGAEIEVGHPFVRDKFTKHDEEGGYEVDCWKPGTRSEMVYPDDCIAVYDGMGTQILTVVSLHKPGKYPTRVFYTRKWRDPDGATFGKGALRMTTLPAFRKIIAGYRVEIAPASGLALPEPTPQLETFSQ
jgi:hypothetical protein